MLVFELPKTVLAMFFIHIWRGVTWGPDLKLQLPSRLLLEAVLYMLGGSVPVQGPPLLGGRFFVMFIAVLILLLGVSVFCCFFSVLPEI